MLGLYLASPLTRNSYLAAKALAVVALLALVTLGPPLLMLLAFTLIGQGPDGPAAVARLLGEVLLGGVVVALLHASLSLAASSTTTRKAAASAGVILILLASAAVSDALVNGADASAEPVLPEPAADALRAGAPDLRRGLPRSGHRRHPDPRPSSPPTSAGRSLFTVFTWLRYRSVRVDR